MDLSPAAKSVWAKSVYNDVKREWLPLWLHLLDTTEVARHLALHWYGPTVSDLLEREFRGSTSGFSPLDEFVELAAWISGTHDIGKTTPSFSQKVPRLNDIMQEAGLRSKEFPWQDRMKLRHALAGEIALARWLETKHGWTRRQVHALTSIVGAHHGIPAATHEVNEQMLGARPELHGDASWETVRFELLDFVLEHTGVEPLLAGWQTKKWSQPFLVLLSGLVMVADWIASNTDYFPTVPDSDDATWLLDRCEHEKRVNGGLSKLELPSPWKPLDLGEEADQLISSRFSLPAGARATAVQEQVLAAARSMEVPGLMVIQESTGGGKTEAALLAAEVLAARSGRAGVLFALPTQATTDAMFARELAWLQCIQTSYQEKGAPDAYSVNLLHGRARLNKEARRLRRIGYEIRDRLLGSLGGEGDSSGFAASGVGIDETSLSEHAQSGARMSESQDIAINAWFNGRKKAMLSDFVVTTVDHLLFGAMRSPHLAMRHLGLSRKVVIVDEVHSYSTYMNVYLDRALTWLACFGVPVILLSATLSQQRTAELVDAYQRGLALADGREVPRSPQPQVRELGFPCLVTAGAKSVEVQSTATSGRESSVQLRQLKHGELLPTLQGLLAEGGCALIVRNTVRRAQETYEELREVFGEEVALHHARFTIAHREERDADLLRQFGPPRLHPERPYRAIVVATQVVEQSLDVDFDLLVTDLAPIDLILQRMGRLHRHERPRPTNLKEPLCYIDFLPNTASTDPTLEPGARAIYGGQDMLLTASCLHRVLAAERQVSTPADVRRLIEEVYGDSVAVPENWTPTLEAFMQERDKKAAELANAARAFLLPAPPPTGETTNLIGWLQTHATADAERGRAQVRDGEDSLEVILLVKNHTGGQEEICTLPSASLASTPIPLDRIPDKRIVDAVALSAVRLPPAFSKGKTIDAALDELEEWIMPAWQQDPALKGQLFLPLENGRARLAGKTLQYSADLGLMEVAGE